MDLPSHIWAAEAPISRPSCLCVEVHVFKTPDEQLRECVSKLYSILSTKVEKCYINAVKIIIYFRTLMLHLHG